MQDAEDTIEFLKRYGKTIALDAREGLREARQVMEVYEMYYRWPDHATLGVLMGTIDQWKRISKRWDERAT